MLSMTGYGRAEVRRNGTACTAELRSVNSRYLEVVSRLPRSLTQREGDIKELIRSRVNRGKISITLTLEKDANGEVPLTVNASAAKSYYKLLNQLRKAVKIREQVKLEHLLKFSEVLEAADAGESDETEWAVVEEALGQALEDLNAMRAKEGTELARDLEQRVQAMAKAVDTIEGLSRKRVPQERSRLQERVGELISDKSVIDQNRLELEVILLAEKLDVTEECVRFRSHIKFFIEALRGEEAAGRKLNFLVQEINREANTIGSKSNDVEIAHLVVRMKEEMEKVREQLQNIE